MKDPRKLDGFLDERRAYANKEIRLFTCRWELFDGV